MPTLLCSHLPVASLGKHLIFKCHTNRLPRLHTHQSPHQKPIASQNFQTPRHQLRTRLRRHYGRGRSEAVGSEARRGKVPAAMGMQFGSGRTGPYRIMVCPKASAEVNGHNSNINLSVGDTCYGLVKKGIQYESSPHGEMTDPMNISMNGEIVEEDQVKILRLQLTKEGIHFHSIIPGQYMRILCPKCGGAQGKQKNFSLFIREDLKLAMWHCFSDQCRWRGHVWASAEGSRNSIGHATGQTAKFKERIANTSKIIKFVPLSEELITFFTRRMISNETLTRNGIVQHKFKNQAVIAFPYRRNGALVSCKYRSLDRKFWQEKDTERIFYGVDDIRHADNIIIVEGEIDKLSMEEAGFRNCVSVPNGAPKKVSQKEISCEQATRHTYLLNCEEYFKQASCIVLATDADQPGQALAEELAFRLGIERCWRVRWPQKNDTGICKDANEVLVHLGRDALKEVIENAEPWLPSGR